MENKTKEYIGMKHVRAVPMKYREFCKEKWGETYNEPDGNDDGYKVIYKDGYFAWSPKDVFEEAYKLLNDMR